MNLAPEPDQLTHTGLVWLEIAERLTTAGDGALVSDIQHAKNGRRLGDEAPSR